MKKLFWIIGIALLWGNTRILYAQNDQVYVTGYALVAGPYGQKYWLNGKGVDLEDSGIMQPMQIFVSGSDVYIIDNVPAGGVNYWKNGTIVNVFDGSGETSAIFVSGSDVYVAGKADNLVAYWKNGAQTKLTDGKNYANATALYVSGYNVYVSGYEQTGSLRAAKCWKNGNEITLDKGKHESCEATSVFVIGSDVYAAGYGWTGALYNAVTTAVFWKNGQITDLTDGTNAARATSLFVAGNTVYVAGYDESGDPFENTQGPQKYHSVAKYWQNGTAIGLSDGKYDAQALSLYIAGKDVYTAGYEANGEPGWDMNGGEIIKQVAKYWKNGVAVPLSDGKDNYYATSIFVGKVQ
jgi:hypothetical protein